MTTKPDVHVFAYGSNMCSKRMRDRVPTAMSVAIGYVPQRQFIFHKRGNDGSAKADAVFSGISNDRVWGVVYRICQTEKAILDQYESLGIGYDQQQVNVVTDRGSLQAWMYVARHNAVDPSLLSYSWYHDYIICGACEHQLPDSYVEFLKSFESLADPDSARHARNRRVMDEN